MEIRYQIPGVGHPDRPLFDVLAEAFQVSLQSAVTEGGVKGTVDINTRVVHTSRFGVPASINIELALKDSFQIDKAEGILLAELRRLGEELLPTDLVAQARKQLRHRVVQDCGRPECTGFPDRAF